MLKLYLYCLVLFLVGCGFIAASLFNIKNKMKYIFVSAMFIFITSFGFYSYTANLAGLNYWLSGGEEHYKLLEQFVALGGVDGAIIKIKQRLKDHPDDEEGKKLLEKLTKLKK